MNENWRVTKGPKVQRDLALLLQLLRMVREEQDTARTQINVVVYTERFMGNLGFKICTCTPCSSMMGSASTTAAIIHKYIKEIPAATPEFLQAKVYALLGEYLYTQQAEHE